MADEKKTTPEGPKKFMTGTWQSLLGMAVLGLLIGLIVAAACGEKDKDKSYALFATIFAVFAVAVTYGTQMLDVKVWKTKDNMLVPPPKAA